MLPVLLNTPHTEDEWDRWSFHHRASHDAIRNAIQTKTQVNLPQYIFDPIDLQRPKPFLEANQQAHQEMDNVLKVQGSDLEDVDIRNERQLQAWIYLHWLEHQTAEANLGISS